MKLQILPPKTVTIMLIIGATLNIVLWLLALFMFPQHEAAILHYSVEVGIDFIGEGQQIVLLPTIGLLVLIGNNMLGFTLRKTDINSAWLAWSSAPVIQLILLSAFLLIWQAN